MFANHSDREALEHAETLGFYSVVGVLAVAALGLAGILGISIEALSGLAALLAGL